MTKENKENKKPVVHNYFYAKEELIGNNLLFDWFKKQETVIIVLKITDSKGLPYKLFGKILAVGQYDLVLMEGKESPRIVMKHDISSIRVKGKDD